MRRFRSRIHGLLLTIDGEKAQWSDGEVVNATIDDAVRWVRYNECVEVNEENVQIDTPELNGEEPEITLGDILRITFPIKEKEQND